MAAVSDDTMLVNIQTTTTAVLTVTMPQFAQIMLADRLGQT